MQLLGKLYQWYGKKIVISVATIATILVVFGIVLSSDNTSTDQTERTAEKPVRTERVATLLGGTSLSTIGSVEAVNESRIETEASGRLTQVYVEIGDTVVAGSILAQLENATERAAVLQAEGSYEAVLAAAAQSDVSVGGAEASLQSTINSAKNAYRSVFTTADDIVRNLVDDFYSDVNKPPFGFKVDADGTAPSLINERTAIETTLDTWSSEVSTLPSQLSSTEVASLLNDALADTKSIAAHVERVAFFVSKAESTSVFSESALAAYDARFLSARNALNTALDSINNNLLALQSAEDTLEKARLGGTNTELSSANAQVKQALGVLRAAEANLAKTIIRTPISGTVNERPVRTGDFLGIRDHVATVANNSALLITTYISEADRARITIGAPVSIEGGDTGTITRIAPAVDAATKKIEVKIETESTTLANGDTVRLTLQSTNEAPIEVTNIRIPISALKVETDRTIVFTLDADNTLVAHEVTTGPLVGEDIIIDAGLDPEMVIVLDARGLNEGDTVTIVN